MSNKKSGTSPHQRKEFLEDHGFMPVRGAQGSHEVWEHRKLKKLLQAGSKIAIEGLPTNIDPKMCWQMTVADNPGSGLWRTMMKQAQACKTAFDKFEANSANELQRLELSSKFRRASKDYRDWKKAVRHAVKAGTDIPAAPVTFKSLQQLNPSPGK